LAEVQRVLDRKRMKPEDVSEPLEVGFARPAKIEPEELPLVKLPIEARPVERDRCGAATSDQVAC
jgi:hypothetical protein